MNDEELESTIDENRMSTAEKKRMEEEQENKARKELREHAEGIVRKEGKKAVRKARTSLFKSIGKSAGMAVFSIIVVFFLLIGIIAFILTMPGLTQNAIYEKVSSAISGTIKFVAGANDSNTIDVEELSDGTVNALNYLTQMGLDPVGLGFALQVNTDGDKITSYYEDDTLLPSLMVGDGSLIVDEVPPAIPLYQYIWSNERTYLPSEYHLKVDENGKLSAYDLLLLASSSFSPNPAHAFINLSNLFHDLGNKIYPTMTDGMLDISEELFSKVDISIDRATRTMLCSSGTFSIQSYIVDLESWIGRYGKSTELLTALHLATMTSELPEELANNEDLQTKVAISMDESTYNLDFKVEVDNGDGTSSELPITYGSTNDESLVRAVVNNNSIVRKRDSESGKWKFEFEKNSDEYTKNIVTINSLYALINEWKSSDTLSSAVDEFVDGNETIYVKYDIDANYTGDGLNFGAYLGKYNTETKEGTGLLSNGGVLTVDESTSTIAGQYNSNKMNGIESAKKFTVNVTGENSRGYTSIYGLNYYANSANAIVSLNRSTAQKDAITCLLIQLDQYFYYRYTDYNYDDYEDCYIRIDGNNVVTITDADGNEYKMDFDNYNFIVTGFDASTGNVPIYLNYTLDWLKMQQNEITWNNINSLKSNINEKYSVSFDMQEIIDEIWTEVVDPQAQKSQVTVDQIIKIHNSLEGFAKDKTTMKVSLPRIESVTHHWFKDLDFSDAYNSNSTDTIAMEAFNEDGIKATALLTNSKHSSQTDQPYVIKGDVVTLNGEEVDKSVINDDIKDEVGKGYEASKKIFTNSYYYVFDGTAITSKGIYYNRLLENVVPENMVSVSVTDSGSINFIKAIDYTYTLDTKQFEDGSNENGANVIATQSGNSGELTWLVDGEEIDSNGLNCKIYYYGQNPRYAKVKNSNGEYEDREVGTTYHYYVYLGESMKYVSATQSVEEAKSSAEKINKLLMALGVTHLRQKVSFDNTTANGDVATITAFSILEGMKSESSQAVYRDLKEFLIELGYYTKAEFEYLSTHVLTWFIPDYIPAGGEHWPENDGEDVLYYGAILNPINKNEDAENSEAEGNSEDGQASEDEVVKGFEPDLDVVAPGNARILEYSNEAGKNYITIEFDGISQPEIGMLDRYTMTIRGIKIETNIVDEDSEDENATGTSIDTLIAEKTVIKAGTVIGKTGTDRIQVIMKNANGGYIDNVEDYMAPGISTNSSATDVGDLGYFYWIPYESSGDPGVVGGRNGNEVAVGIAQWTALSNSRGTFNNISPFCQWLYDKNPVLCSELKTFISWNEKTIFSDYFGNGNQLKNAFRAVADKDYEAFRNLQMQMIMEERTQLMKKQGVDWLLDRNPVCVGTYFSLLDWAPNAGWQNRINQSMTDEEIIKTLLAYACTRSSTAGNLSSRWESQARIAVDILHGDFTDIEGFINNKGAYPEYGEGRNTGYLSK